MSDYFDLIQRRESCRNYATRPVEREKLDRCIEAARLSPSACNSQPWKYFVVTNADMCEQLRPCLQDLGMNQFVDGCNAFVVVVEQKANLSEMVGMRFQNQDFVSVDIGLSVSQLCYAATEQGLSTCILGWINEKKIKQLLAIKPECHVRLVLCVGYAADEHLRQKKRKSGLEIAEFIE
ncbi:MAG: nitroreductase family protein [Clostridia bacterium]